MRAVERVLSLIDARRVRDNEFRAKCPVHKGRSSRSLSIKDAGDRVLVHCHAGCDLEAILQALGMQSAVELFDFSKRDVDPQVRRQDRIRRGLEVWCDQRMTHVCQQLRDVELQIRETAQQLARCEDGIDLRSPEQRELLWERLGGLYRMRNSLDWEFVVLHQGDLQSKYELFRVAK